jgi:hypothetical protein
MGCLEAEMHCIPAGKYQGHYAMVNTIVVSLPRLTPCTACLQAQVLEEECTALRAQLAESRLRAVQAEQQARQVQAQAEGTARELAAARHDAVLQADATQQQVALREERLQAELQVRSQPGLYMLMMRQLLPGCT